MQDRDAGSFFVSRRGLLKLGLGALGWAAANAAMPAGQVEGVEVEDLRNDLPEPEDPVADALVIEEGEGEEATDTPDLLRLNLNVQSCSAQVLVTAQEFKVNPSHQGRVDDANQNPRYNPPVPGDPNKPGDQIVAPLWGRRFEIRAFRPQSRTVRGISTRNNEGDVLFNGDPQKGPARVLEFRARSGERVPVTVSKLGEGGISRSTEIPCVRLQRVPFRYLLKPE